MNAPIYCPQMPSVKREKWTPSMKRPLLTIGILIAGIDSLSQSRLRMPKLHQAINYPTQS